MSRETDSPSSGPNGRGGAAYPSGTPPYGTPMVSDGGADAGRSAAQPEERKTETTLTTRIRINIPGSRPIPPVVVRKPVADAETTGDDTGADAQTTGSAPAGTATTSAPARGVSSAPATAPAAEAPAELGPGGEEKTSDWFAPRKSSPGKGGQGGGSTNGAGTTAGSATGSTAAAGSPAGGSPRPAGSGAAGGRPTGGRPGGVVGSMSVPGGPRSGGTNGAGLPGGATGGPVAPGHGGGTGSFDVTEALAAGPLGGGTTRPAQAGGTTEPRRDDLPYFTENGHQGAGPNGTGQHAGGQGLNGFAGTNGAGQPGVPGPGGPHDFTGPDLPGGPQGPAGPTGGPVTGDGPMVPPANGGAPGAATAAGGAVSAPYAPAGPGGPGVQGGPGGPGTGRLPGGGLSDDTAILTPQKPAPEPGAGGGYGRHDNVSGQTVTSGIPVVPPPGQHTGSGGPFAPGTATDAPSAPTPPKRSEPAPQNNASAAGSKKKKKKGRSKLVLLGGLVVVGAAGAYGAGLLMNHSDVPKGTTVFGVDIGGGTRDDAVKKLDEAFDDRVNQALKLSVDGKTLTLKPDQAGLQFDMQATVDAAAKSDYNPVSVIGSLFGEHREVEPVLPVDEEKLRAALETAAGGSGTATDGTIKFEPGKAIAVYGKPGKGIDVAKAETDVVAAYRTLVETGSVSPLKVPTTTKQPTVSNAEVDRMMKEFAEPAMSARVTVETDPAHSVPLSPQNSLWRFLGVKAVDGKLVETYDEAALKELYGGAFDDVLITRGTGQKTPVTVQDVISALRPALKSRTDRVGIIETDPS
ncbi:hypothetical protein [Streptomyces sp. A012304]|uniref:hypothetical protein n=1 Tax=Streptomyces sp. A012304 TaxID=375446 RepID=UPI00222FD2C7|nr:hypothetical protein [Streptomyces sp. A012304]GKQ41156.1 hypothetical protein ALMP_76750 [Streptomyces sp. A012304]